MTSRTRYFVIASLLVLLIGLGAGLVAYYVGLPTSAFFADDGPDELRFVPPDATLVAFANVHEIMTSDLRERVRAPFRVFQTVRNSSATKRVSTSKPTSTAWSRASVVLPREVTAPATPASSLPAGGSMRSGSSR